MTSKTFDQAKFMKLMALTESDHDGEALAAARKAKSMARANGMSVPEAIEKCGRGGGKSTRLSRDFQAEMAARAEAAEAERAAWAQEQRKLDAERAARAAEVKKELEAQEAEREAVRAAAKKERRRKSDEREAKRRVELREFVRIAKLNVERSSDGGWVEKLDADRVLIHAEMDCLRADDRSLLKKVADELAKEGHAAPEPTWTEATDPSELAAQCLNWPEVLTEWEREFCTSVAARSRASPKQWAVLNRVSEKVRDHARSGMTQGANSQPLTACPA
jgi:hypothetical protein